jgi:hypothetical protein
MKTTSQGPENNMTVSVHFSHCNEMHVITRALACYNNSMIHAAALEAELYPDKGHAEKFRDRAEIAMEAYRQITKAWGGAI